MFHVERLLSSLPKGYAALGEWDLGFLRQVPFTEVSFLACREVAEELACVGHTLLGYGEHGCCLIDGPHGNDVERAI